ncbi:MAG: hypothetical protein ACRDU0_08535 [Mycobacterium sp.]
MITHCHDDHRGSLAALSDRVPRAVTVAHRFDAPVIRGEAIQPPPVPWTADMTRICAALVALSVVGAVSLRGPPVQVAQGQSATPAITYPSGWNLIGASEGTTITGVSGQLYTLQAHGSAYQPVPAGLVGQQGMVGWTGPEAGSGYWAYFPQATTIPIAVAVALPNPGESMGTASRFHIEPPPGRWVMIGNPYSGAVTLTGADGVDIYEPTQGYQETMVLQPGQGAFAFSATGQEIVICPVRAVCK